MTAITQDDNGSAFKIPADMKAPLIFSGVFHLSIVVLMLVGLPYISTPSKPMQTAVPVEILPIGEITTTNKPPVQARPKPPEEELQKPVQKEKPPAPPKMDAVEPPKDTPKPVEEVVKPKPKPVIPPPPKEQALKEPEPKPVEKPKEEPAEAQPQEDFASLLRNLQESEPVVDETLPTEADAPMPAPSPLAAFSEKLTMSEADALSQQLSRCWSIQAGARYAEDLVVQVRLTVSPERRVMSATIEDQWRYGQDSYFRAAADSAIRAVNSPQCEILQLPPEKYDLWKDIVVTFDPRDML